MPVPTIPSHCHRYHSYILDLKKNWAYSNTIMPGRNRAEKQFFNITSNKTVPISQTNNSN